MSAALRPSPGGLPSGVLSGALRSPNSRSYGLRSTTLAGLEVEGLGSRAPPAAGWFSPGPADLDVIPGRVFGLALVGLLPDVIEVVALAQGRDNRQTGLCRRRPEATELTTIVKWCMGVTESKIMD